MSDPDREHRIEELVHTEPTVERTLGQKVLRAVSAICLTISLAAVVSLAAAYLQLRSCTNEHFSDPSGLHQKAAAATARYADATDVFATAVVAAFNAQPSSANAKVRVETLKRAAHNWRDASKHWKVAVRAANTYEALHPVNRC